MSEQSIVVAVATHKPYQMPSDQVYLPLHAGAALHPDVLTDTTGDDTGDNISLKNSTYCELTGLYWLWKNCDAQNKGLVHYRRLFASPSLKKRLTTKDRFAKVATGDELATALAATGVVVPKKRHYYIESIYSHYQHTMDASQFDTMRAILQECAPQYVPAFDRQMKSTSAHLFNMFVMRSDLFDAYCEWLFPLIDELVKRVDASKYDAFAARFPGRVSEVLLDVWLNTNGHQVTELPVISPEPVDWPRKIKGFLMAKFAGKKYTKSF